MLGAVAGSFSELNHEPSKSRFGGDVNVTVCVIVVVVVHEAVAVDIAEPAKVLVRKAMTKPL